MSYLPGPVDPQKSWNKNNVEKVDPKKVKKNNVDKEGSPPARPPQRGVWGAQLPGKRKKDVYIKEIGPTYK